MTLKNWIEKILVLLLFLFTLFGLILPIYHQSKSNCKNQILLEEMLNQKDLIDFKYQKKYNDYLLDQNSIANASRPDFSFISNKDRVIGFIEFPTLKLPVTSIYSKKNSESVFYYKYGSFPTVGESGHLVISINDHWKNQANLVKLAQLKVGDCFYLRMGKQKKAYQITSKWTGRNQEDFIIIPNKQLLTIEMEDSSGFTNNYTFFESKQIALEMVEKVNSTPKILYSYQRGIVLFFLLNGVLFTGLVFKYQGYARKAHSKSSRSQYEGYKKLRRLLQITRGYYIISGLFMLFFIVYLMLRHL